MSYIVQSLSTGEQVVAWFRLHWSVWLAPLVWFLLGFITFGLTWIIVLWCCLRLRGIEQGLTTKRVILKRGIIGRKTEEMQLSAVETVEIQQGMTGRLFGYGTVKVTGRGIGLVVLSTLADPLGAKRQIENACQELRRRGF